MDLTIRFHVRMCLLDLLGFSTGLTAATTWPRLLCPGNPTPAQEIVIVKPHRHRLAWRPGVWRRQLDRSSPAVQPVRVRWPGSLTRFASGANVPAPELCGGAGRAMPPCRGDCLTCRKRCRQKHWKHSAATDMHSSKKLLLPYDKTTLWPSG